MREAGCRQVLIGLESPAPAALEGIELQANFKAAGGVALRDAIADASRPTASRVNGCFILGLDGHTPDIFQQVSTSPWRCRCTTCRSPC